MGTLQCFIISFTTTSTFLLSSSWFFSALKLEKNQLLDKRKVEVVVKLMMKHWRVLDSTPSSMRIGKISGIKHKILLKQDAVLSHEKPRPLNPIIREEVEKTLRKW